MPSMDRLRGMVDRCTGTLGTSGSAWLSGGVPFPYHFLKIGSPVTYLFVSLLISYFYYTRLLFVTFVLFL